MSEQEQDTPGAAQARVESANPWHRRWRSGLAVAGVVVVMVGSFFFGQGTSKPPTHVIDPSPPGTIEVVDTGDATLVVQGGDASAITDGTVTPLEFRDQSVNDFEIQRFSENVTSKSQELKSRVDAGDIEEEDASDVLAIYIGYQLRELTDTPPSDNLNLIIKGSANDIIDAAQEELVSVLVERLVGTLIGGSGISIIGRGDQPTPVPPPTPSDRTSVETTSQ